MKTLDKKSVQKEEKKSHSAEAPRDKGRNDRQNNILKELDVTGMVAYQYGFTPIIAPKITLDDKTKSKQFKESDIRLGETEERIALTRLFHDQLLGHVSQPPMLYFKKPFPGSDIKKRSNIEMCGLEILNVSRAAAEALVIKTAWAILSDCGCENMRVEVNSTGDKESFARFERDLHAYFRKNIHTLDGEHRQKFKENNLAILSCTDTEVEEFVANAPKPLSSLSEISRIHFKEVLEFLESATVPYQINCSLFGNTLYASHTVFEIKGTLGKDGPEMVLATGGRYNYLGRKAGYKKDIPCCGATVFYPKKIVEKKKSLERIRPANFYLVQLGNLAKLQTLNIIEILRQEHINVYHSLTKENIGGQLASAEYLKVSHLLIVGQKEAIERSVVVRSTDIREQETVLVDELCTYLKRLAKSK